MATTNTGCCAGISRHITYHPYKDGTGELAKREREIKVERERRMRGRDIKRERGGEV